MTTEHDCFDKESRFKLNEVMRQFDLIKGEAQEVRNQDKALIKNLFGNFYEKELNVGLGFQRSYGSILSGDYFELIKLPDQNYLFIFADISGHGLPAYTTLIRLRSAQSMAIRKFRQMSKEGITYTHKEIVETMGTLFTDILEDAKSKDFASILFTFITHQENRFQLQFFSRGMHFPFVSRCENEKLIDVYNLNEKIDGWEPEKSYLLGSEIRMLTGKEYENYNSCEFTVFEGDSILFFSDGLIESTSVDNIHELYGYKRLEKCMRDNYRLYPQVTVNQIFEEIYSFIGKPERQFDDMTAVLIHFPLVR